MSIISQHKTLFIAAFHFLASRNLFTTDFLSTLVAQPDLTIVIFVPDYKKDYFKRYYASDRVIIESIDHDQASRHRSFRFFKYVSMAFISSNAIKFRMWEEIDRRPTLHKYVSYYLNRFLAHVVSRVRFIRSLVRLLDQYYSLHYILDDYFIRYKPDMVFATDVFNDADVLFLQSARAHCVFSVGMVRSWDNTTTKGLLRSIPDMLVTNNDIIKKEAVYYHDVQPQTVFVGGIPQFDLAFRHFHSSRDDFFKKIDVDPRKRLVFFGPAGYILSDTDWQICELLKRALFDKRLPDDIHFLVSMHPGDPPDLARFEPDDHFTIMQLGQTFEKSKKVTEMRPDDARDLVDFLYHSEIVMYVNSTVGMDSLPFDKPQIIIEFDGWETKPYIRSVKHYHDETHMQRYLNEGAVTIVRSPLEMIEWINTYLHDPSINYDLRQSALQQQLQFTDGRSGERIARFILDRLSFLP